MKKYSHKNTFSCFKNGDILAIVSEVPKSKKTTRTTRTKQNLKICLTAYSILVVQNV